MSWEKIQEWISHPFVKVQGLELSLGVVIKTVVLVALVLLVSKWTRALVRRSLSRISHLDPATTNAIATLVYYAMLGLGLAWALASLGLDATSVAVFTGGLGLGIGLGFQDMAKNFISGIVMLISKTIKPGDVITVDDLTGRVVDVGMYSSRLKTVLDATVIIPNSRILNERFVNWTHDRRMRMLEIPIGVHYDSDVGQVMQALLDAAGHVEGIMADPEPRVLLVNFGESSIDFVVRAWTAEVLYFQRVASQYNLEVWRRFQELGLVIPYPQRDLYVKEWPAAPVSSQFEAPAEGT